jgi:hypothetical protein
MRCSALCGMGGKELLRVHSIQVIKMGRLKSTFDIT